MDKENILIDYVVHESALARMERINKRLFNLLIAVFIALVATNMCWFYYENQFEDVVMTQTVSSDGAGDVALNGVGTGELNYYGNESNADDKNP
jgi:hypothetical protein